jgi:hypothetical protein
MIFIITGSEQFDDDDVDIIITITITYLRCKTTTKLDNFTSTIPFWAFCGHEHAL